MALGEKCWMIYEANSPSKSWFIFPQGKKDQPSEEQ